jgi:hypothetical protein
MVSHHHPVTPRPIVVKPARVTRRKPRRPTKCHCVVCGAELRDDHPLGDLVCDCHPRDGYQPRAAPPESMLVTPEERVLVLMYRAGESPLNLYRALGCDDGLKNTYNAVQAVVWKLNASGLVRIVGAGKAGRKLVAIRQRRGQTMGT